jgi:lipopolysaccharide export system permease protein
VSIPFTLSLYFGRNFAAAVLALLVALAAVVGLFDFLELLRESATAPQASFGIIVEMEFLRLPWIVLQILPFAVLLGGLLAFWRLARSSELVVARAAGISAWQFLAMPVFLAALFGAVATTMLSPVSAMTFGRAELLYNAYLNPHGGPLSLNGGDMWVRQADHEFVPDGVAILHAENVRQENHLLTAGAMLVLRLDGQTNMLARVQAGQATLNDGAWDLHNVTIWRPNAAPVFQPELVFPTDLTVKRVQQSFASPDALSFWALPGFIELLKRAGFSPIQHELAFQALLALPLLCATMALVAAGFSMRPGRQGAARTLVSGVACGFALFMVSEIANQFGTSGAVPVILAAWAPALAGLCLALALLLHLEDG